jgi:DNA polymerase-3 subunit gamma/tau
MRDALSILDKIVSFTNGTLTYANTLEHLNVLDEAYYFKLLEHLTSQDLTGAMLLYDEINAKGFEGDTVLYGIAGFIRNLLVCKDAKSAHLLESIEGWRDQYIQTAQQTNTAYLVSALNILNEAEIQFKMARNKRLHVELALIKLNFLQQAIELSLDENQVVKKKLVDAHYPIRLQKIPTLQPSNKGKEAKLIIEEPLLPTKPTQIVAPPTRSNTPPVVEKKLEPVTTNNSIPAASSGIKKGNLLATLQQKYGAQYAIEEVKESIPLEITLLQKIWDEYMVYLETNAKHSAAGTFKMAKLSIEDEIHFTATVPALTAQKFIEQEKTSLLEKVWEHFHNRAIQCSILIDASENEEVPLHMRLNNKQKYERIVEQYPLVQELKQRLNMELYF